MGRWKAGSNGPYYDENDSGPDQVAPPPQQAMAPQAPGPGQVGGDPSQAQPGYSYRMSPEQALGPFDQHLLGQGDGGYGSYEDFRATQPKFTDVMAGKASYTPDPNYDPSKAQTFGGQAGMGGLGSLGQWQPQGGGMLSAAWPQLQGQLGQASGSGALSSLSSVLAQQHPGGMVGGMAQRIAHQPQLGAAAGAIGGAAQASRGLFGGIGNAVKGWF